MTPDHAIALSEILPEIPMLAHFDITGNTALLPAPPDEGGSEEGAALFTALVAAVKVSKTIVRVDTDDLGPETGDVVRALARRVLAYCLRNMEAGACDDWTIDMDVTAGSPVVAEDDDDDVDFGGEGWDEGEHYVVGGTGVVKALGVCLGNKPNVGRRASGGSVYGTPMGGTLGRVESGGSVRSFMTAEEEEEGGERAGEMARSLLRRARRIKERIQPALRRACCGQVEEMQHREFPPFLPVVGVAVSYCVISGTCFCGSLLLILFRPITIPRRNTLPRYPPFRRRIPRVPSPPRYHPRRTRKPLSPRLPLFFQQHLATIAPSRPPG